ncbi:MAG TPA: ATP-dependent helicase HrpB [Tepidisphaeraceae bacterium]|nr:ATP-dependent helicase HrpB [Tepidisphaeraceae bacterium]
MVPLPIDAVLPEVVAALKIARALVLVAPPGAGKTTRVPPAVLKAGLLSNAAHPNLVMLQPRRVAARASAQRIAEEQGWDLGREVGYHVRFDKRLSNDTRLRVLTEGILSRQLLSDPFLDGIGCVILDEFHERSLHTDLAIAMLREVQQTVREDLILIVMSATLEAEPVSHFLGDCPIVRSQGRLFPIEQAYLQPAPAPLPDQVADIVRRTISGDLRSHDTDGDVLVFLPGAEEIRRTGQQLDSLAHDEDLLVVPLHGSIPFEEQKRALRPADRRKVILATNIAETSLTIEGVRTVIDAGRARVAGYDPQRGLDRLELKWISKASAAQRAGRAGRTAPGRCVRMWTERHHHSLEEYELPEVKRVDLAGTVLALHAWGADDPRKFGWYEAPPEEMLAGAERLLAMLGALSREAAGKITPLGRRILSLPTHPRLARLLIAAADAGIVGDGAAIAALLSEKDIASTDNSIPPWARGPSVLGSSDLLLRVDLLAELERSGFRDARDRGVDHMAARQVIRSRDELLRIARRAGEVRRPAEHAASEAELLKLPLLAYPDRVARRRDSNPAAGVMVGGVGVKLAAESVVRQGELFLALDARSDARSVTREALVRVASRIEMVWLEELFPQSLRRERGAAFDAQRQRVVGQARTYYHDLLLRDELTREIDPAAAAAALYQALLPRLDELICGEEQLVALYKRVEMLERVLPRHLWPLNTPTRGLPPPPELLRDACTSATSVGDVKAQLFHTATANLTYEARQLLNDQAPEALTVPTGNRLKLDWSAASVEPLRGPVLAVRLQEVFGWIDTPRVMGGAVPVVMHLLGPNYRPVQVTQDLRSFWTTTYFQVRKDLKARYPKHAWPEDPLAAIPQARGRSRK